jgi:uncharacterized protein YjbI with pentapeptide repeats
VAETIQIKHRFTDAVLFECEAPEGLDSGLRMRHTLEKAVEVRADLSGADLSGAYLRGADLSGAYLRRADLSGADLSGAYLRGADLSGAYLRGADLSCAYLRGADLSGAYLSGADLSGAYLSGADLSCAYLRGAYLRGADLSGADLRRADLSGADLSCADLSGAKDADYAIAMTRILPEGDLIGWKKCNGNVIVKLRIPADAKRSHAFGRKCRAEFADVLEVFGAEVGISQHDGKTEYRAGARVTPDSFEEDWTQECAPGVHFFISRIEAENY